MTEGWGKPATGGTVLRIPAIQSPNFVNGVSGWIIRQDGSAQFNSIVIPPGTGGNTIFTQATAPTAFATGDLWVDTAVGNSIFVWNGSTWVAYQFGTSAIASGAITAALIAANTITAAQIAANTITAGQIAANTITASQIAANTITASQIAAATITATQIAAATIDSTRLGPNAVTAANVAANQFGLNMVADPQFTQSSLNTIRAADAFSTGSWSFSANTAICAATTGGARLALMPSTVPPMWVYPGEQYYVSCTFTTTAASTTLFVTIATDGGNAQITQSGVAAGTHTLSGVVTIPAGAHTGYFRFSSINGSSNATTVSNPICQPAALFSPTITGTDYIINSSGAFFYSGTPALGNLIASITQAAGTDAFGNAYYTGFCAYGTALGGAAQITQVNSSLIQVGLADQYTGVAANGIPAVIADGNIGGPGGRGALTIQSPSTAVADAVMELDLNSAAAQGTGQPAAAFFGNIGFGGQGFSTKPTSNTTFQPLLYTDAAAIPRCFNSSTFDGTLSVVGRDWNHSGTINSATFSNILSVACASGQTYKFDMMLFLTAAHSAGQWQIQVAGPTNSLLDYNFKWTSAAGVTGLNVGRATLSATQAGPNPSVTGAYWAEIHGFITTTAAGHIVIKAASSTGATDTWTYDISSFLELLEIA
jgi:hypothetical protein